MTVTINGTSGINTPGLVSTNGINGNALVGTSVNSSGAITAGGIINANAGQIKFPATQNASSDANTLDDYEEGTWFPTYVGGTTNPTVTYSEQFGKYTKIGNVVYFSARIVTSSTSGGSGQLRITLPFVSTAVATGIGGGVFLNFGYAFASSGGFSSPSNGYLVGGSNYLFLKPDVVNLTELQVSNLSNGCYLNITGFFYV